MPVAWPTSWGKREVRPRELDRPTPEAELQRWAAGLTRFAGSRCTLARPSPWLHGPEPHSGHTVGVQLHPAPPGAGIAFTIDRALGGSRRQPAPRLTFPATLEAARHMDVCLAVGRPGLWVAHVEHLLAACRACGLDDAWVLVRKDSYAREVWNRRAVPILASGALGFVRLIRAGELAARGGARPLHTLREPFEDHAPGRGDRFLVTPLASPDLPLRICYHAGFPDLGVEPSSLEVTVEPLTFLRDVAPARTMLGQLNHLPLPLARGLGYLAHPSYGLGLGVGPHNTMAPVRGRLVNAPRFGSPGRELVRHKIIDLLGALALAPPLAGLRIEVHRSGHANDLRVLRRMVPLLETVP